jgi:quinoprotein glucose dehydrogenase
MRVRAAMLVRNRTTATIVAAAAIACLGAAAGAADKNKRAEWRHYLGGQDSASYSTLTQINRSNVTELEVAWTYQAGANNRLRFNPIVVDDVMYVLGKDRAIVALDAATGKQLWSYEHDPLFQRDITDRGINYWESKDRSQRRLLFAAGAYLQAVDAKTGKLITSFGKDGKVDLREGLGRDPKSIIEFGFGSLGWSSPGRVFENLLIVGSRTGEAYGSPPGDIRAFDVITGKQVWTFHTVPHPGEFGYDGWPKEAYKEIGGINVWGDMSLDEARGIIYAPTGSPTYDFYGADRIGTNLFGNCLLALDARTGRRLWHYQVVHHDLWDYDNTAPPQLLTVRHNGRQVDAVAMAGKTGFLYVFNRVTGEPLWPIEERAVPQSDVPGEQSWPTQPFPTVVPPFGRQTFTVADISPYLSDDAEREKWTEMVRTSVNKGLFTPPAMANTMQIPGNAGGANWGTTATDPVAGVVYVLNKDEPTMLKLEPEPPAGQRLATGPPPQVGRSLYRQRCQTCHGEELRGVPPEIPTLVEVTKRLDSQTIKRTVVTGRGRMPGFQLGDRELNGLIAFLSDPATANAMAAKSDADAAAQSAPAEAAKATGPVRYWSGYGYMRPKVGPAPITPPWSTLTAYDLNKGTIKWQVPLGEVPELAARGIKNTGSGAPRGAVVTAGGLIFTGTPDNTFRAFDKDTGKQLWERKLTVNPLSVASTYEVGGRQFVVIGGSPPERTSTPEEAAAAAPAPDATSAQPPKEEAAYVVFALPAKSKSRP